MERSQRISIGVVAVAAAAFGLLGTAAGFDTGTTQISLRVAILLGAIWFAAPAVNRLPRRVAIGIGVALLVLMVRPKLILWGLVAGLATMVLMGRQKR